MPLLSGVELYRTLTTKPKVIFTTAHTEYAVEGFDRHLDDRGSFNACYIGLYQWRREVKDILTVLRRKWLVVEFKFNYLGECYRLFYHR